ncbi:hypothetical protein [Amorphus orientalis]|uniref:Uncharacterized protein n=1 Tax=Amorphus orientalis TaxID=649198 RepID=A0AAE3VSW7_9HYPH|nr:hypothetical protein [Amorphus orientalis]MDQ0317585.1 hypothetical protein [Amorphus orientalis]
MTSYLADTALLVALVVTSVIAFAMYRRLKRLEVYHSDYKRILAETDDALQAARSAVATLNAEGRETALALAGRIEAAERLVREIDTRTGRSGPSETARSNDNARSTLGQ